MISKPRCFNDLLELQRILDENIEKNRKNGFVPRKRNVLDILLAIDDEFQEWLRELPKEYLGGEKLKKKRKKFIKVDILRGAFSKRYKERFIEIVEVEG